MYLCIVVSLKLLTEQDEFKENIYENNYNDGLVGAKCNPSNFHSSHILWIG